MNSISQHDVDRRLPAALSRRQFVTIIGASAVGASWAGALTACSDGPTESIDRPPSGSIEGSVVDLQGQPQGVGRVFLLRANGFNTGVFVDVNPNGQFVLDGIPEGEHPLRFHAPGLARVPPQFEHPVRVTVERGKASRVQLRIERGAFNTNMVEIYAGDDFFQEQPYGIENGETVVKLGTVVCWYNTGLHAHTVTGGPWVDSGDMPKTASFIWVADRAGLFAYRCKYHLPQMQATLRVTQ